MTRLFMTIPLLSLVLITGDIENMFAQDQEQQNPEGGCPTLPVSIPGGEINSSTTGGQQPQRAAYTCHNDGRHVLVGQKELVCQGNHEWSSEVPVCAVTSTLQCNGRTLTGNTTDNQNLPGVTQLGCDLYNWHVPRYAPDHTTDVTNIREETTLSLCVEATHDKFDAYVIILNSEMTPVKAGSANPPHSPLNTYALSPAYASSPSHSPQPCGQTLVMELGGLPGGDYFVVVTGFGDDGHGGYTLEARCARTLPTSDWVRG